MSLPGNHIRDIGNFFRKLEGSINFFLEKVCSSLYRIGKHYLREEGAGPALSTRRYPPGRQQPGAFHGRTYDIPEEEPWAGPGRP